jgi:hypothetical protein
MAKNNPKKAKADKTPTTEAASTGQQPASIHYQALAAHANALTAHALALSEHARALSAAAMDNLRAAPSSQQIVNCVLNCLRGIAPGANITNNSILSRIPIPDLVALGRCINGCVPLHDPSCWGGGVNIDGSWRVSDLIHETETLQNMG